jgi:thiamine pyrophosphate-dependent acetolactate synthase large subunit-like protein
MNDSRIVPVFQILAEDVYALGIRTVFGLMSDDTAVFAVTLDGLGVKFVGARHENNAIAMAEGYAYSTGGLGVALIGRGPATANGLHAAVAASRMGSKVLVIYGDAAAGSGAVNGIGPDYKGFNAQAVLGAAGVTCFTVASAATARQTLGDAVAAASHGTLAALLLPTNVQMMNVEVWGPATPKLTPASQPTGARRQSIDAAAAVLSKSRRPVIVAGMGAHRAGAKAALQALAEKTGALLMTSARGKDMFHGHPYNLGILGSFSHSMGRRMMDQADCVLVFGAGLNFLTMSFGAAVPQAPIIQVDSVRAHIGRWTTADVAVVGDARLVAEQLLAALPGRPGSEKPFHTVENLTSMAGFDIALDFEAAHTPRTVDPRALGVELDKLLPRERNIVYDAGNFLGILPYITVPTPGHLKMTSEFASIGLGFGTALGVAKGRPHVPTVLVIGDGGFLMTMSELETVIREDIPLIIVLMNDCAYGAELHFLAMRKLPVGKSVFPDVDFATVAEAFGFQAYTIRTLDELRVLGPVLSKPDGPILLDCKVNPEIAAPFMGEFSEFEARHQS